MTNKIKYKNILIVEDNADLRGDLERHFSAVNNVTACGDLKSAIEAVKNSKFDIALLDVVLPDGNGLRLFDVLSDTPVVILSDLGSDSNMLDGFSAGAADYIVKPASAAIIEARMALRLLPDEKAQIVSHGLVLNVSKRTAIFRKTALDLTSSEFNILMFLMQNAGVYFTASEISDYDFIKYNTAYDKKTENFVAETKRTNIDLQFYGRRQAINRYQIVTVHYQSSGSALSGITEYPLIGTDDAVKGIDERSQTFLLSFAILAAVVGSVLIVMSLLKRTGEFIYAIIWICGIAALLFSRFLLWQTSVIPMLLAAFSACSPFVVLGGALFYIGRNFGKVPTKYIFPAIAGIGALLAFIAPFAPFIAAKAIMTACTALKITGLTALTAFLIFSLVDKKDGHGALQTTCAALIDVAAIASVFLPRIFPTQIDPLFWLYVATTIVTFVSVFLLFNETEKANSYLTANLHMEIERQIKDIKSVVTERDNLLQFVSHDMKKPLQSSVSLLDTAIERERDAEQIKTLKIIKQNDSRVITNLSEIGEYARFNYIAEPSQVVELSKLCAELHYFHLPDCNANGIILRNLVDKRCRIFGKKQGLENAVSNIIMNAVEHANCKNITLYARTDKNRVALCVADDGKGISPDMDVFKPYVSEKTESGGVGLFICKNIIESMNGILTLESKPGSTIFCISLLKA